MNEPNGRVVVEVEHLWKIFGERVEEARNASVGDGLSKDEIREQFGCVLGVIDASFSVYEGEIFCIMGLSGSGKSTLVRHINRLIEPTFGRVLIDEQDVNALGAAALRQLRAERIGMVFQNMALMPHRTVRDNVAFSLELRGVPIEKRWSVADRTLELVQLDGWGDMMPGNLSGGMQQRVGLARAMAADPEILLMDEPFSALDPLIRRQLQDQFLELAAVMKKTTIFITHDLDEAIRIGNRIAIMKDGFFVQIGTPEEIVMNPKDQYVEDFVRGISRLKLVKAHSIMEPYEKAKASLADDLTNYPVASSEDDLDHLIDIAVQNDRPILINDSGGTVGVIEHKTLLRGIQGGRENGE